MGESHRVTITLHTDNSTHALAWRMISAVPKGSRTEYICGKIIAKEKEKGLEEYICKAVKKALAGYDMTPEKREKTQSSSHEAEELKDNILGFISALSKEGG